MKSFRFGGDELKAILVVLAWTVGSGLVAFLIDLVGLWDIPVQYLWIVPTINMTLYSLKEFIANNR